MPSAAYLLYVAVRKRAVNVPKVYKDRTIRDISKHKITQ
jgi:hypothetical protein